MRIIIIVADGEPYEKLSAGPTAEMVAVGVSYKVEPKRNKDQNLQAMEFWNSAVELAGKLTQPRAIWVPKRVFAYDNQDASKRPPGEEEKFRAPQSCEVKPYDSAREVVDWLKEGVGNWQLVVVIGHGARDPRLGQKGAWDGAVELCEMGIKEVRRLESEDLQQLPECVYIGLHCYALTFAQGLPDSMPAFHLSGEGPTSNGSIARFLEICTKTVQQLSEELAALDGAGEEDWKEKRDKAQNTLDDLNKIGSKIENTRAGVVHQLPDKRPEKAVVHPNTTAERSRLPQLPSLDEGNLGESIGKQSNARYPFPRVSPVAVRSGYRVGIATWNAHGLSKRSDESTDEDDDEGGPLAVITDEEIRKVLWLLEASTALAEGIAAVPDDENAEEEDGNDTAGKLAEELTKKLAAWSQPYVRKQMLCYQQLAGPVLKQAVDSPTDRSELDALVKKIRGALDDIDLDAVVPRLLTRKLACLGILELFRRHKWLDILVVQEVKFSGIDLLIQQVKDELSVYAGPLMKSSGSKKRGEREYYPLIMRKDACSRNHQKERHLTVDRIWWLTSDGQTEELPKKRVVANQHPEATWEIGKMRKRRRGSAAAEREVLVPPDPDLVWNKHAGKASFRPVINYDLAWVEQPRVKFHVGVVHTTPGGGGEFDREYEFDQIESMIDSVSTKACSGKKEDAAFAGPWLLAGDYYLFKESRITKGANSAIKTEFQNRLAEYQANGRNGGDWRELCLKWRKISRRAIQQDLIDELREGSRELAKCAVNGTALTRSRVRAYRESWWLSKKQYEELAKDREKLLTCCASRAALYNELSEFCQFHSKRAKYLRSKANEKLLGKWAALLADNAAVLRFRPSTSRATKEEEGKRKRSGKSDMDIKISVQADPTRAVLGQRFVDFVDETPVEITQAVAGTNTHLFRELPLQNPVDPSDARYDEYLEKKAYYAAHLKVADFIVHTAYDEGQKGTDGHWRAWCLGLLCPDVGTIVLADSDSLAVSRFWACFSDHFPVGGMFSTEAGEEEEPHLFARIVRLDESPCLIEKVKQAEQERLRKKWEDLQTLAELLGEEKGRKGEDKEPPKEDSKLAAEIRKLEAALFPHEEDRGRKDFGIGVMDYGWNGVLDFLRVDEFAAEDEDHDENDDSDGEADGESEESEEEDALLDRESAQLVRRARALFKKAEQQGKGNKVGKLEDPDSAKRDLDKLKALVKKLEEVVNGMEVS